MSEFLPPDSPFILFLPAIQAPDKTRVGSKAINLARLFRAGFPVPEGFCITAEAFASPAELALSLRPDALAHLRAAYLELGSGPVAVRSSAVAEDLEEASFAGQYQTFLDVQGEEDLLDAVRRCVCSLTSSSAQAYQARQQCSQHAILPAAFSSSTALGILVQRMIHPEVAGVLFTANPLSGEAGELVIEVVQGLGQALVSGNVTPEQVVIRRSDRHLLSHSPAPGSAGSFLSESLGLELLDLGTRIEREFGCPQDIEWARAEGRWYVLQSRPITALGDARARPARRAQLRQAEIARLQAMAEPGGTVWSSFNLSETLPFPTPMTWSILERFLSGRGGVGLAYRDLGFRPSSRVDQRGFMDLVCGRPYYNLSREPELYFAGFPFEHSFEELKAHPARASYPQPRVNIHRASPAFFFKLPFYCWAMVVAEIRLERALSIFDQRLRDEIFPRFEQWAQEERETALSSLSNRDLLRRFEMRSQKTLTEFGREALKATLLAGRALGRLEALLLKSAPQAHPFLPGLLKNPDGRLAADVSRDLEKLGTGRLPLDAFLERHGHRASREFDLACPRWREIPEEVLLMARLAADRPQPAPLDPPDHEHQEKFFKQIPSGLRPRVDKELPILLRYLPFRESGKSLLMRGYELVRLALLEMGRRSGLGEDIFFLEAEELEAMLEGKDFRGAAERRKAERAMLLEIEIPPVIFSDDLDAIGRSPQEKQTPHNILEGMGVSPGVAQGPALVVLDPSSPPSAPPGFILVCPSSDPGWTPLFMRAGGLVAERGGLLSHSAIVARELRIPAVLNVPYATSLIRSGQQVRLDGLAGNVILS